MVKKLLESGGIPGQRKMRNPGSEEAAGISRPEETTRPFERILACRVRFSVSEKEITGRVFCEA
jgi:hypothetical protein